MSASEWKETRSFWSWLLLRTQNTLLGYLSGVQLTLLTVAEPLSYTSLCGLLSILRIHFRKSHTLFRVRGLHIPPRAWELWERENTLPSFLLMMFCKLCWKLVINTYEKNYQCDGWNWCFCKNLSTNILGMQIQVCCLADVSRLFLTAKHDLLFRKFRNSVSLGQKTFVSA